MIRKIVDLTLILALSFAAGIEPALAKTLLPIDPMVPSSGEGEHAAGGSSAPRSMNHGASPEQMLTPYSSDATGSDQKSPRSNFSSHSSRGQKPPLTDDLIDGLEMRTGFAGGRNARPTNVGMSSADLGAGGSNLSQSLSDGLYSTSPTQKGRGRSGASGNACLGAISSLQCGE